MTDAFRLVTDEVSIAPFPNYERGVGSRVGTKVADVVRWLRVFTFEPFTL